MNRPKNMDAILDEILNALCDMTRRNIVRLFDIRKEMNTEQIVKHFKMSRPNISHHLGILRRARILKIRKDGKTVYYSLDSDYFLGILKQYIEYQEKCCRKVKK